MVGVGCSQLDTYQCVGNKIAGLCFQCKIRVALELVLIICQGDLIAPIREWKLFWMVCKPKFHLIQPLPSLPMPIPALCIAEREKVGLHLSEFT